MSPVFTIGIPTFNRLHFLKEAVAAARWQTLAEIEIIISDNGSSDGTEGWCRSLKDPRIRYFRSDRNRGPSWNFKNCLEHATGTFFSWLQDDDVIFADFAGRAVSALEQEHADFYLATAIYSPATDVHNGAALYSPPVPMDWVGMKPKGLDAALVAVISLFVSIAIPPVIAFRTATLRGLPGAMTDSRVPLYAERLAIIEGTVKGKLLLAPHVAGVFRMHPQQMHKQLLQDAPAALREWHQFAELVDEVVRREGLDITTFSGFAATASTPLLESWYAVSRTRSRLTKVEQVVHDILAGELGRRGSRSVGDAMTSGRAGVEKLRRISRKLLPPIFSDAWRAMRARLSRGRRESSSTVR